MVITAVEVHAQGVGADSLRLRSNAGGQAWLLLPQTTTAQYRLLLPSTLGTANHQLMWINGGTGQISLLPPGLDGQVLQYGAGGLSWVSVPTLISGTAWLLTGNSGTNPTTNFLGTTDNQPLVIRTNNTERLRITESGNLGLGITNPTVKLSLGADLANTKLALYESGGDIYGLGIQASQFRFHVGHSGARFSFLSAPAGTEVMTIQGGGNVGIGTASPSVRLHVAASTDPLRLEGLQTDNTLDQVLVANSSGVVRLRSASSLASSTAWSLVGNSGTNPTTNFLGTTDGQPLVIRTNNTERLRITQTGDVGIGTTTPSARLHVAGSSRVDG
ncbi:MAG: hypothetical protein NZ821_08285, partial [Gloeomargarita sp. SKYB31]|nr:hypothetical protein [Gloeomargarita sp. SKYB31]